MSKVRLRIPADHGVAVRGVLTFATAALERLLARSSTILALGNTVVMFLYTLHVATANEWRALHVTTAILRLGVVPATALTL